MNGVQQVNADSDLIPICRLCERRAKHKDIVAVPVALILKAHNSISPFVSGTFLAAVPALELRLGE